MRRGLEAEFQLELVSDRYSVRPALWDGRLEVSACPGNRATVEGDDLHAPGRVRARGGCRWWYQPEPRATCLYGSVADGIE
jgi:hypothetical protein